MPEKRRNGSTSDKKKEKKKDEPKKLRLDFQGLVNECVSDEASTSSIDALQEFMARANEDSSLQADVPVAFDLRLLGVLMSRYTGTKSAEDRKILEIITTAERFGVKLKSWAPLAFGPKSLENYENLRKLGLNLHVRLTSDKILDLLDEQQMWDTVINCNRQVDCLVYDETFILPLLASILLPGSQVSQRKFVETNALSLVIACTSSQCDSTRRCAYFVLQRFLSVCGSLTLEVFEQRPLVVYILRLLKNSIENEAQLIPNIITQYLARAVKIALNPELPVFAAVMNFLTQGVNFRLPFDQVPDLRALLYSTSTEKHEHERRFLLDFVKTGVVDEMDYNIITKNGGFRYILSVFSSPLCDRDDRAAILDILKRLASIPTIVFKLVTHVCLPTWLALQIKKAQFTYWERGFMGDIYNRLLTNTLVEEHTRLSRVDISTLSVASAVIIQVLRGLTTDRDKQIAQEIEESMISFKDHMPKVDASDEN